MSSAYLAAILTSCEYNRSLRRHPINGSQQSRYKRRANCAVAVAATRLGNRLPLDICTVATIVLFKARLLIDKLISNIAVITIYLEWLLIHRSVVTFFLHVYFS